MQESQWCSVNYGFGLEVEAYEQEKELARLKKLEKPEIALSNRFIATGGTSDTADDAIEYLKEKGAKVDSALGITVIQLPDSALLEGRGHEYAISFYDEAGNYEDKYVTVDADVDASWTILKLRNDRNG